MQKQQKTAPTSAMRDASFRRTVLLVVLLSAGLRFGFLFFGDVLPVMWDARRYVAAGLALISYVDRTNAPTGPEEKEHPNRLRYYNDKYLQGEQVVWKPYSPSTLKQARNDILIGGPLYPLVLATIFYLSPVSDLQVARTVGVLMDIISTWLFILIAARLAGRPTALVAGVVYACYFPFIQTSTMLLLENSTTFLLMIALYFVLRAREDDSRRSLLLGGIASALLILNKPSAMFLWAPLAFALYWTIRKRFAVRDSLKRLGLYLAPTAIVLGGWLTIASLAYGQLTLKEPTYQESSLRQSSKVESEGYDLDIVALDFWTRPVYANLLSNGLDYGGLFLKKFTRLWARPFNDFKRHFILPYEWDEQLHVGIVVLGFIGLVLLALTDTRTSIWPWGVVLYYCAIHIVLHSVARYAFSAMPLVILGASFLAVTVAGHLRNLSRRSFGLAGGFVIALLMAWVIDYRWIESVLKGSITEGSVYAVLLLKTLLMVLGVVLLQRLLLSEQPARRGVIFVTAIAGCLTLVGWNQVLARDSWSEFSAPLVDPNMRAGTKLYISKFEIKDTSAVLAVVLDVNAGRESSGSYKVRVGNLERDFRVAVDPPTSNYYVKSNYEYFLNLCNESSSEIRQYVIYALDPKLVKQYIDSLGFIDISIVPNPPDSGKPNYVVLYGNRAVTDHGGFVPSIPSTSIERYVFADDPRVRTHINFMSDSTISYYIRRGTLEFTRGQDLAVLPGIQRGRYNMFLVVLQNGVGELY